MGALYASTITKDSFAVGKVSGKSKKGGLAGGRTLYNHVYECSGFWDIDTSEIEESFCGE